MAAFRSSSGRRVELHGWPAYVLATAISLGVAALQQVLLPLIDLAPFILLFLAVFLSAWFCGRGPGILSMALGAFFTNYHVLPPRPGLSLDAEALVNLGLFLLVAAIVVFLASRLRDALSQSEETARSLRYQLALNQRIAENAAEAIFVTDREGQVTFANPEAEAEFGFRFEELRGKVLHDLIHHHHRDGRPFPVDECPLASVHRRPDRVRGYETLFFCKDGSPVEVLCATAPLMAGDEATGAVLVARDISAEKRAARALRESEADLNRAQTVAQTGSWRLDVKDAKLHWSAETYRIFGVPEGTPQTYDRFLERIYPEEREMVDRAWKAALAGAPYDIEHRVEVDGVIKWVRERAELEFDPQGRVVGGFGTVQDITKLKRAEEALLEADRRKNEFLAVLSHELRNPLAPIRNSLYVLQRAPAGSPQANKALETIGRQVTQMTRLIEDLLDVTRIVRGKIKLHVEPVNLSELVRNVFEDHRGELARNGIEVSLRLAEEPIWVRGDRVRLGQIVGNLLHNAAKFTPSGGRALVVLEKDSAGRAVIRVFDTGIGMEPQLVERLFQPFMQADRSLDRAKGGLGLGLALVKGLAELHGGSVEAHSEGVGKGSEFVVRLPASPAYESSAGTARVNRSSFGRRVLIIEDNTDAAESLREAIALSRHTVEVAYTGPEGLDKARRFRPEVVLCDLGLPGMDGYEVARRIRADPELGLTHLVAVTGYAGPEDRAKAASAGFDRHMAKPPDIREIEEVLSALPHTPQPSQTSEA